MRFTEGIRFSRLLAMLRPGSLAVIPPIPPLTIDSATPPLRISPTDVSQFIRLDQCERFLRLQLHWRANGQDFMRDYDVAPQSIPPILTRSGADFESAVESGIATAFPIEKFSAADRKAAGRDHDNAPVVAAARALRPGNALVLSQPRLEARLGHWQIRGDVDLIRMERSSDGALEILIADMKSSTSAKVEHRLQVAFYHEMLTVILAAAAVV